MEHRRLLSTFTFPDNRPNGTNQTSILIATAEAESLFGVTADLVMTPVIAATGGKACFDGPSPPDCVAWGNYAASPTGVGNAFSPAGLTLGQAAQRRLDRGNPGLLDPSDDTDDSATDFVAASPTPRNNANVTGTTAGYASTPAPPGPIDFGAGVVGFSLSATLSVRETGGRTLTVSSPVVGGANPGDFSVTTAFPLTLPDGTPPQTLRLACTPQAEGTRTATLTLTTSDPAVPNCGIPSSARAVSLNFPVTQPTASGNVRLFPAGGAVPLASTINYAAGQTRANNAVIGLSVDGELSARCQPSGSTHLILDVSGYFE